MTEQTVTLFKEGIPTLDDMNCRKGNRDGQMFIDFDNGYTASLIQHEHSYGATEGLFEIAVMIDGHITYDTPITNDVLGYLTPANVLTHLNEIKALPKVY